MIDLKSLVFSSSSGVIERTESGAVCFSIKKPPFSTGYTIIGDGDFITEEYFVIEYSTRGWRRPQKYRDNCITAEDENGEITPLVCYDDLTADGKRYTVVVKIDKKAFKRIKITLLRGKGTFVDFNIYKMYTCSENELPVYCENDITDFASPYRVIDISDKLNRVFKPDENSVRLGGGRFFDSESISLLGIPFKVSTVGNNCIAPPPPPSENDEIIENFGVKAPRRICRPISRKGETVIETPKCNATEIYFLLSVEGKRYQRCAFAAASTIIGSYGKEVTLPLYVDDVEGFAVETVYCDGRRDISLPFNASVGKHGITGDISLYAIAADGSEIEKIIFHNKSLDTDFSLIALTVNETQERLFPDLIIPTLPDKIDHKTDSERFISLNGDRLTIKNGAILMSFDLTRGLYLDRFENTFTKHLSFRPDSMLKIKKGSSFVSEIKTVGCVTDAESATIDLTAGNLALSLCALISEKNCVKWSLSIKNEGEKATAQSIIFPYISGIEYLDKNDSWYFVPKYQNINSNETVYIYEESAPSFPMQFLDVYSPIQQGGIALTTEERELIVRKYALEKTDSIEFYVEYPEMYGEIAAGDTFICSPTLITAHEGDWRESFKIYKKWLDSWYTPYHCQDKQWYRESFWLLAEITDFFETEEMCSFPIWYNKDKKEFNYLKILEEQKEISGYYPDILHMWAWSNRIKPDGGFAQKWGNFGESEYADYGGLENFRNALHEFMEKKGVMSSVYLHPTLLSDFYPQFEKYKHLRVEGAAGNHISIYGDSFRMCHASEEWREYALAMYPRVYSELKVPILYVDEFSLRIGNRCFAKHHGHEVPSNLLKTDRNFITRLKEVMPDDVVLYGEYAAVDVNARYIDCNISYSIIDTVVDMIETAWHGNDGDNRFSRVITDIYRFAFPKIVQLVLPMAMRNLSWHPQKFIFFNGEAIYDSLWDIEESEGHKFVCKAYGLKKKYADCFASDTPETMIDTLSPAICMNKFPGKGRTVYTVYNRAYTTYRGGVLRIKHEEGNEYYDAWNDEPLKVEIKDGFATIDLTVHAQSIGCIVITEKA